jgi:hypothetical protein
MAIENSFPFVEKSFSVFINMLKNYIKSEKC